MRVKRQQLRELIRLITKTVLKEYSSSSSMSNNGAEGDTTETPVDAMTSLERSKKEREDRKAHLQAVRTADMDLKGTKTQSDYFSQQLKQNKLKAIAQQKELQNLKAGKTVSSGGAGAISAK
jgi:hypothetical protein